VVLMGYANPIERYDQTGSFIAPAHEAGVDGVLVVDYPPEECEAFAAQLQGRRQLDPIFLLAPTSSDARIAQVGRIASGYVYYVSLKGVTGAGHLDTDAVAEMLPRIRRTCACRWAWVSASATRPRRGRGARWPTRW
jgi:tryptophan synthase alpha chain